MMNRTTITKLLVSCPACDCPINATLTIDVTPDYEYRNSTTINMTGTIVGARISHDCNPPVSRGQ